MNLDVMLKEQNKLANPQRGLEAVKTGRCSDFSHSVALLAKRLNCPVIYNVTHLWACKMESWN